MRKSLRLFLLGMIATAITLLANVTTDGQDFAVSIVGMQQSHQFEGLPMVYYGRNPRSRSPGAVMDEPSFESFFVVIQNVQRVTGKIRMGASSWYDCLQFTIKTSSGKTYSISRRSGFVWSANPMETWIFPGGGIRIMPVDFTGNGWQGLTPPLQPTDLVVTMTVTFRYPDAHKKMVSVTSRPTDVNLYPE